MNIRKKTIISDLRIFEAAGVSREHGRNRLKSLEAEGVIKPEWTPTGRCRLSMKDAEKLTKSL